MNSFEYFNARTGSRISIDVSLDVIREIFAEITDWDLDQDPILTLFPSTEPALNEKSEELLYIITPGFTTKNVFDLKGKWIINGFSLCEDSVEDETKEGRIADCQHLKNVRNSAIQFFYGRLRFDHRMAVSDDFLKCMSAFENCDLVDIRGWIFNACNSCEVIESYQVERNQPTY